MLVYADDVALHQWVGPVAVHEVGLCFCAQSEEVVLAEDRKRRMRGNCAATWKKLRLDLVFTLERRHTLNKMLDVSVLFLEGKK